MALTAATMTAIATSLRGAATAHGRHASTIGAAITATGTAVDAVDPMWRGPSTETAMAAARAFLTDVADVSTVIEDAQAVLDELAAFADEVAAELSSAEATLSRLAQQRVDGLELPDEATDRALAHSRIAGATQDWTWHCGWTSLALSSIGSRVTTRSSTVAMGPPYPATPQGAAYAAALSRFSLANGVSMDVLDPRGETHEVIDEMIADFATTPDGMVVWLLIETMADGDISDRDGAASGSDVDASMDAGIVLERIARFEVLSGRTLSEPERMALLERITGTAAILKASERDDVDDIDIVYPDPEPTSPDDPDYQALVQWLDEGQRGSLVSSLVAPDDAEWTSLVGQGTIWEDGTSIRYFEVVPNPGAGVVVIDFFIPDPGSLVLAGDDRDHADPVFGNVAFDDSRMIVVLDMESGRASIQFDDTETYWGGHMASRPIVLNNDSNPYGVPMDDMMQTGEPRLTISNTVGVTSFMGEITIGYDALNSITPVGSVDGVIVLQADADGTYQATHVATDEYPSMGVYQYQGAGSTTVVMQEDSEGVMRSLPWWFDLPDPPDWPDTPWTADDPDLEIGIGGWDLPDIGRIGPVEGPDLPTLPSPGISFDFGGDEMAPADPDAPLSTLPPA